jgi:hypothetical protein
MLGNSDIKNVSHKNLAPWPKNVFDIEQKFVCNFFPFLWLEILKLTVSRPFGAYFQLNVKPKFTFMKVSVHASYSLNTTNKVREPYNTYS